MIPSASDQRTIVLPKRKINTERGVDGFAAAARSSVSAMRAPSEMIPPKASAEGNRIALARPSTNLDAVSKTMPALVKRERAPGLSLEEVPVPKTNLWRCDPKIPMDVLSCSDPLGNAVHTALAFDLVGEDVLITGAGPIGCMAVPIAKMAGARKVVITDINPYRLDLARKMG